MPQFPRQKMGTSVTPPYETAARFLDVQLRGEKKTIIIMANMMIIMIINHRAVRI